MSPTDEIIRGDKAALDGRSLIGNALSSGAWTRTRTPNRKKQFRLALPAPIRHHPHHENATSGCILGLAAQPPEKRFLITLDDQMAKWQREYAAMRAEMFFGAVPSFDVIMRAVGKFEKSFNAG